MMGVPGSGKTFTALSIASRLVPGGRVAVIDTEQGSAKLYSWIDDSKVPPVGRFVFDMLCLTEFSPSTYVGAITAAGNAGYDVIVVDSLSHAWNSKGGALEMASTIAKRSKSGNTFNAWGEVTPEHNKMVEAILRSPAHVIVTMRVKAEYAVEKDERTGKSVPKKIGMAPIQRGDLEYEFDVVGDLNNDHAMTITKTRCSVLANAYIENPGEQIARVLRDWLDDGVAEMDPMRTPLPPAQEEVEDKAAQERLNNPRIKELFDLLGAPEAKRLAALTKYATDGKLIEVLEGKVKDAELVKAKEEAKAAKALAEESGKTDEAVS
jgi:hypothetical protein